MAIILLLVAFGVTLIMRPFLMQMVKEAGFLRPNYQGELIPVSMGIIFIFGGLVTEMLFVCWQLFSAGAGNYFPVAGGDIMFRPFPGTIANHSLLLAFAVLAMGLLGFIDDFWGTRATTGLKGHLSKLFRERQLTTGALKALGGGFVALSLSLFLSHSLVELLINTLLLALCTNALNLLDLRPGRAIKGFLLAVIPILLVTRLNVFNILLLPYLGAVLAYFPLDLRAKAMMGDVGSNVLGILLGLSIVWNFTLPVHLGVLLFLIALHLYTEKYSLTKTIEHIPPLRWLDEWGRPRQ